MPSNSKQILRDSRVKNNTDLPQGLQQIGRVKSARPYLAGESTTAIQFARLLPSLGCANELLLKKGNMP
jgi:hypothetical protein